MTVTILRADARALPLPDASVDLVITSPPYFALRAYEDGGEVYPGQLGSEATPGEFLDALLECTAEMARVLKPSGSIWLNLGDKYCSGTSSKRGNIASPAGYGNGKNFAPTDRRLSAVEAGVPVKSLMLLPHRFAIRAVDELGLICRQDQVWSKPNALPESVTDRTRRSHEYWFHLVKQPRYFTALDEIREGYAPGTADRYAAGYRARDLDAARPSVNTKLGGDQYDENPLGKIPGSVWSIPSQPLKVPARLGVKHYAAFPMEWPRRLIRGWAPTVGVCTACGQGRRPVVVSERPGDGTLWARNAAGRGSAGARRMNEERTAHSVVGHSCGCRDTSAVTRPAVVLDPFGGTGTVALMAHVLGCHGVHVDLSADYNRIASWRTTDPGQLAAAMQVEKPPVELTGQFEMFSDDLSEMESA